MILLTYKYQMAKTRHYSLTFFPSPDSPGMTSVLRNTLSVACLHAQHDLLLYALSMSHIDDMQSSRVTDAYEWQACSARNY